MTTSQPDPTPDADARTREFLRLLSEHDRALYAYILALVPNIAEVQDIAQEVRLRLWDQFDKFEPGTNFGAWSRSIAHYLILAHRKKSTRKHAQLAEPFLDCVAEEVAATVDELPRRQSALRKCLEKLTTDARSLLMRYYSGKRATQELVKETGRSAASIRQAVCRSRRVLAECIQTELGREDER